MRIALFSDIHGNSVALDAVLRDIDARGGVDHYCILGDMVALGPDPIGTLERLVALPNTTFVRGNTDRYITTGTQPQPVWEDIQTDPTLLPLYVTIAKSFAWTAGAVAASGWLAWLHALPIEQRLTLPDGTRLLGVHAAPGCDDGEGIRPTLSIEQLQHVLVVSMADLLCVGHTHWAMDVPLVNGRIVNLGSVSNPFPPDLRASYSLLAADTAGYYLHQYRIAYDHNAVVTMLQERQHPAADYLSGFQYGRNRPPWQRQ